MEKNLTPELQDFYREYATRYLAKNREWLGLDKESYEEFDHICYLAASLLMSRDFGLQSGSFITAVLYNDLDNAIGRADAVAIKGLRALVVMKSNCDPLLDYRQKHSV